VFKLQETGISGCFEIACQLFKDERGSFVKTFHLGGFSDLGLATRFAEEYYSVSRKNVLRGLHFQLPPMDHEKLVYCLSGTVLDVVLDIRIDSPTFGEHRMIELSADKGNMVYMPRGIAHGFMVTSDHAVMQYKVTSVYSPDHDAGILWNSAGIQWPVTSPVVSARDSAFPAFMDFTTPFRLAGNSDAR